MPLGLTALGIEKDTDACDTGRAAGHARLQADIAELDPLDFTGPAGLIASPPCQGFSMAGKGGGRRDSKLIVAAVGDFMAGRDPRLDLHGQVEDPKSVLALEPLRWALSLRPEWMAWEQVPAVLPLWEACAEALRADGYSVWVGNLYAEQYAVPQTRKRAGLIASRNQRVDRPTPTHSRYYPRNKGQLDLGVEKWISMAEALGGAWSPGDLVGFPRRADNGAVITIGGQDYRERDLRTADQPAFALTEKCRSWARWQFVNGNQPIEWQYVSTPMANSARRNMDEPAPTIMRGHETPQWVGASDSVRVTVEEAACLQSFPDYPWQGSKTAQYRQVGDAVPPGLALHVVAEATGLAIPAAREVAA